MAEMDLKCSPKVIIGSPTRSFAPGPEWGNRALLLADSVLEKDAAAIQDKLDKRGINTILFAREGLPGDTSTLDEVLSLARGSHARVIVALGGEKVMSLGRLTAAAAPSQLKGGDIMQGERFSSPGLPLVEVPSSGRHSLLYCPGAVLTDSETRQSVLVSLPSPPLQTVFFDPALPAGRTVNATALSIAAVLAGAIEAFLSPRASFFSDNQAISAVRRAAELLRDVKEQAADPDFRLLEAEAAILSAFSTGLTSPGPALMLSRAVAALAGVPGASVQAVLLPWVLESPLYSGSPKLKELSRLIADPVEEDSNNPVDEVRSLFGILGLPGRLREIGADLVDVLQASVWAVAMSQTDRTDLNESAFRDILELAS
jgi:alcohol dehydrogenase class IV